MKIIQITKYRLHGYFASSKTVFPGILLLVFISAMYSIRPMSIVSGFILSGVFHFILMIFVSLQMNGAENVVEEQLQIFHGGGWKPYCLARETALLVISAFYGLILSLAPVVVNCVNEFQFFTRILTAGDVLQGMMIILGAGFAGIAIGDLTHPRIIENRALSLAMAAGLMLLSLLKNILVEDFPFLNFLNCILPPVMKPAYDFANGDYFVLSSVLLYFLMMLIYYMIIALVKNAIFVYKKFA